MAWLKNLCSSEYLILNYVKKTILHFIKSIWMEIVRWHKHLNVTPFYSNTKIIDSCARKLRWADTQFVCNCLFVEFWVILIPRNVCFSRKRRFTKSNLITLIQKLCLHSFKIHLRASELRHTLVGCCI